MEPITIKIEQEIDLSMLNDIITTALEGGSNYWYLLTEETVDKISKHKGAPNPLIHGLFFGTLTEAVLPAVMAGEILKIHDVETEEEIGELSIASIKEGLQKMAKDMRPEIKCLFQSDIDSDYDAETADVIFQYICLGEIVYG